MHEYYRNNILKLKKENEGYLRFVKVELEQNAGKPYSEVWEEIWGFYEKNLLEHFPYIGGDKVSGTKNLTGAYIFVAMGEVLKRYGVSVEGSARLMVLAYERKYQAIPRPVRAVMRKIWITCLPPTVVEGKCELGDLHSRESVAVPKLLHLRRYHGQGRGTGIYGYGKNIFRKSRLTLSRCGGNGLSSRKMQRSNRHGLRAFSANA